MPSQPRQTLFISLPVGYLCPTHHSLTTHGQSGLETRALHVWEPGDARETAWEGRADAFRLEGTAKFQGGAGKLRGLSTVETAEGMW